MKDNGRPETRPHDEPLFVLRYRQSHVILRVICFASAALFFGGVSFIPPYMGPLDLLFRPISVFLFLIAMSSFADPLLFKEVRFYTDRMVLVRKWFNESHIELSNAWFVNSGRGLIRKGVFSQQPTKNFSWILSLFPFRGISYYEDLADPQDARKLDAFLALLSGRKTAEFNQPGIMFRLIKEGTKPRIVDQQALDRVLFQDMKQAEFYRTANIGLLIVGLLIMLGNVILLWPFIRSALR
jgi:hypothetical protein